MTSITDIRNAGPVTVLKRPIYESVNAPTRTTDIIAQHFGSNYNIAYNSNLYKFVIGLIGDSGVASLTRGALIAKLQDHLSATYYDDLDRLYGNPIGLTRLPEETYTQNPFSDYLTNSDWDIINAADASYRHRCLTWMRAILFGGSPVGMALAAEAGCGVECDIFEQYNYLNDNTLTNYGLTTSPQEFVIIPRTASLTQAQEREINHRIDRLKPANTLATINRLNQSRTPITIAAISASTTGFLIKRLVTGRSDVNWPPVDLSKGHWITTSEQEAPTVSHISTQETTTYLSVASVTASSEQIGIFNKTQRGLFPVLGINTDPFFTFNSNNSFSSSSAPLSITSPWFIR